MSARDRLVAPPGARRKTCVCGCRQPWLTAPAGSRYDHERASRVVRFFARHLRHTKGRFAGRALVLEPWQEWHLIRPVFGVVDVNTGLRWYSDAVWGIPRKNGKSTIAAGCAAYLLVGDGEQAPEVYSLAGGRDQAKLVFREAKLMMRRSPLLKQLASFYASVIEVDENAGLYKVMSSLADLVHGTNPSGAVIDEFHVHKSDALREAIQTGTGARDQPLTITISTAPKARAGPMWELMRPYLFPRPDDPPGDPHTYFSWIGLPAGADAGDPRGWKPANPASWITQEYLAKQFGKVPSRSFEQLHLNRVPAAKGGGWLPSMRIWDGCGGAAVIDPDRDCVIGVDAAPKRDLTAVVLTQLDDRGVVHARCWTFQADPDLGYLDFDVVEGLLRDLARQFRVTRIVVDPFAMMRSMMTLASEGLPVEDFPQNHQRMVPASMGLHQLVIDGRLRHGGDPALTAAAAAATTQTTSYGWRLVKGDGRIDPLVALAMAVRILDLGAADTSTPTVMVV